MEQLRIDPPLSITICQSYKERLRGFMFQRAKITTGKCFPHCNSIHTFFVFQPLDLVLTDEENNIIALYPSFPPWRILLPQKGATKVYELPIGTCQRFQVGQVLPIVVGEEKKESPLSK